MTNLSIVHPFTTNLYAVPLPTKRRAIFVAQGQSATIQFQFLDNFGNPVDLSIYTFYYEDGCQGCQGCQEGCQGCQGCQGPQDCTTANVVMHVREALIFNRMDILEVQCIVIDDCHGIVECALPLNISNNPGVYELEFGIYQPELLGSVIGNDPISQCPPGTPLLAYSNKCYLWVDRGLFGCPTNAAGGPPTVDEIRIFIRDSSPDENLLLDNFEFDLADLCQAAVLGVQYWNESQPPLWLRFNTVTYPAKYWWMHAIAGYMLMFAAHRYRRNQLPYQAGGISIDDQNKEQQYLATGSRMVQEYKEWVKQKKVQINCEAAISSTGSEYQLYYYFR